MTLPRLTAGQWFLAFALIALLGVPLTGDAFYIRLASRILIFGIIAMGLNLIVGYTGLVSFGHAAFVGVGAYTVAILNFHGIYSGLVAWPCAVLFAGLAALAIGALALRTSGVYFIMITLAFAQMLFYLATGLERYGGDDGIRLRSRNSFGGLEIGDPTVFFAVVAVIYLSVLHGLSRLVGSRFGRALRGIKDNERRMQSVGYNTYAYKLAAFVIAGATAGLGGALNANLIAHVSPSMLHWVLSGDLLIIIILGGVGTIAGPTLGAAAFILLEEFLSSLTQHWMAILGAIMLAVILFHRGGLHALVGLLRRHGSG
jgi:branched-chain amino acid transport system permease protein